MTHDPHRWETMPRCYTTHSWFTRLSLDSSRCGERVTTCCLREAQDWLCIFSWMERGNKPPNPRFHQERMIYMLCKKPALWSIASPSSRPQPSGASGGQSASEVRPWRREKRGGFRVRSTNPWWGLTSAGTNPPHFPDLRTGLWFVSQAISLGLVLTTVKHTVYFSSRSFFSLLFFCITSIRGFFFCFVFLCLLVCGKIDTLYHPNCERK